MISNEVRNEIEGKGNIPESKNNNRNKKMQEYQNKRERTQVPRKAYSLTEHLHNRNKRPISGRVNPGSSESDLMGVCVKGKLVHINNVHKVITRATADIRN